MQVWIVCLILFFGIAEFYQWAKGLSLPMPVMIASGALLAVASNFRIIPKFYSGQSAAPRANSAIADETPAQPPLAQMPASEDAPAVRSISFTIRSPETET